MKKALIGYSGFVGSNLLKQGKFTDLFNSKNISEIAGKEYDEIWCAGISGIKWRANINPKGDWLGIIPLLSALNNVKTERFVLISTVDVFIDPNGVNEDNIPNENGLSPYGLHRLEVEKFVANTFSCHHIIRLPGLFGIGLKKNIIYDFLNNNNIEKIHSESKFQFYDLNNIYKDCTTVIGAELPLIHFAVAPVSASLVAQIILRSSFTNKPLGIVPANYNFYTKYASLFGSHNPYIYDQEEILKRLNNFVSEQK